MPVIFSNPYREPPPPAINGFIKTLGGTESQLSFETALDSSDNIFIVGQSSEGVGISIQVAKYNNTGTLQWQRGLSVGSGSDSGHSVATDSSGNLYMAGRIQSGGAGGNEVVIAKWNSSGVLQWQNALGTINYDDANSIAVDTSNNVYLTAQSGSGGLGGNDVLLIKYNTSGAVVWQRSLGSTGSEGGYAVATDAAGNVYLAGKTNSVGPGTNNIITAKYNSSGTVQWQRYLGGTGFELGQGIAVDASSNVFVTAYGSSIGLGGSDLILAKYNTSGAIQWQRALGGGSNDRGYRVATDASGNVYVMGSSDSLGGPFGGKGILIAKYNTSGAIQWQRGLGGSFNDSGYGIKIDGSGDMIILGHTSSVTEDFGNNDFLIAKLPNDGSETGTYGNITYAATSLTEQAAGLTDAAAGLSTNTPSLTENVLSKTEAATTLTETVIAS